MWFVSLLWGELCSRLLGINTAVLWEEAVVSVQRPQTGTHVKTSTSLSGSSWPPADSLKTGQNVGAKWSGLQWDTFLPEPGGDSLLQLQRKPGLSFVSCHSCFLRVELHYCLQGRQISNSMNVRNEKVDSPEEQERGPCPGPSSQFPVFHQRLSLC